MNISGGEETGTWVSFFFVSGKNAFCSPFPVAGSHVTHYVSTSSSCRGTEGKTGALVLAQQSYTAFTRTSQSGRLSSNDGNCDWFAAISRCFGVVSVTANLCSMFVCIL